MGIFDKMEEYGAEQVTFFYDKATGLKAINCINNTVAGPSSGGVRHWDYESEGAALEDVLRLSKNMTYKNACAGANMGGGKTAVLGDAAELKRDSVRREAFWRTLGRFIDGLNGRYWPGCDVNTSVEEMMLMHAETNNIITLPHEEPGDTHTATALGVFRAIEAACLHVYGSRSVKDRVVSIQGVGGCGYYVCKYLHEGGAKLIVTDIDESKVQTAVGEFGAQVCGVDEIYDVVCDIYSPNALGGTLNSDTIPRLKCEIVCGSANNSLLDEQPHSRMLADRNILFVPDYIANAGGVVFDLLLSYQGGKWALDPMSEVEKIYDRTIEILSKSRDTGELPINVADKMAEDRLAALQNVKAIYNKR